MITTHLRFETMAAPAQVRLQLQQDEGLYAALVESLQREPPAGLVTLARGSSDHAADYLAYLVMARLGRLVTSLPMSLLTLMPSRLISQGLVSFSFSRSGRGQDVVACTTRLTRQDARTVAFVNDEAAPLASVAKWVLPLRAGTEISLAAPKSFIAQMVASARLVAHWEGDAALIDALHALPDALAVAARQDWSAALAPLVDCQRLYVIARGTGLPVALEAALKFKETCAIQAEAYSGAELGHSPVALIDKGCPVLVFAPQGPAQPGLLMLAAELRQRGARVLLAAPEGTPQAELGLVSTGHEDLDPIAAIQSFYPMVEALAFMRGQDPDHPRHARKATLSD
jgi:glutamine---fructose-6-phosphate transaminase (isomerizing)